MAHPKTRVWFENKISDCEKDIKLEEQNIKFSKENIAYKEKAIENYKAGLRRLEKKQLRQGNKNSNSSKI